MRVAVTYENGEVFQHFGHTQEFKIYEIENGQITRSVVIGNGGAGHEALAELLYSGGIDVLICGGIGGGAIMALKQAGILVCAGVHGNADEAVQLLISGDLSYTYQANCNHHDHEHGEEHSCHDHEGEGCGHEGCCH